MDVATWTTAAGTAALAIVGGLAVFQNRRLVSAATEEATASRDLVVETRADRELSYRPVLSVHWPSHVPGSVGPNIYLELTNSGTGPALSCRYVGMPAGQSPLECMTRSLDVPPGKTVEARTTQQLDRNEALALCRWIDESGIGHTHDTLGALFAKDLLNWRYRFVVVKDSQSQPLIERVERWRPGESPAPSWARSRDIWPDYGTAGSSPEASP